MIFDDESKSEDFAIRVQFLKPEEMRYDTTDDYVWDQGQLLVTIVNRSNRLDRMAILLHALAEWAVARDEGVSIAQIDAWDFAHLDSEEPGELTECPYQWAHRVAVGVEKVFRDMTGTPDNCE